MGVQLYLGEGTVVPEVALVGEAVANVAELALLDVLLDGVERLLLGDLRGTSVRGLRRRNLVRGIDAPPSSHSSSAAPQRSC